MITLQVKVSLKHSLYYGCCLLRASLIHDGRDFVMNTANTTKFGGNTLQ